MFRVAVLSAITSMVLSNLAWSQSSETDSFFNNSSEKSSKKKKHKGGSADVPETVSSILGNSDWVSDPSKSCPECQLSPTGLRDEAVRLKSVEDGLERDVQLQDESLKKLEYTVQGVPADPRAFELMAAKRAFAHMKVLQTEVDRQKLLNQINQTKLTDCSGSSSKGDLPVSGSR